jgi:hypothetical protein
MKHLKTFENFSNIDINEEINLKAFAQKIGLIKDPVKKRAELVKALSAGSSDDKDMNRNSVRYKTWMKKDPEVADKLVDYLMKNSGFLSSTTYLTWDANKKVCYDHGSDTTGAFTPGNI